MPPTVIAPSVLMNVSEMRIEDIRWSGTDDERLVVSRIFETPVSYRHWEAYHAGLMQSVGGGGTRQGQVLTMRQKRFELIHRQALFQYLRDNRVAGATRAAIVTAFHNTASYQRAMVAEHARYLQSNSSLFCADHLSTSIMGDVRFGRAIERYRAEYMDYFSHYCDWILAESQGAIFLSRRLIPALKLKLQLMRHQMLAIPVYTFERRRQPRTGH
jgi:hypothetical protein